MAAAAIYRGAFPGYLLWILPPVAFATIIEQALPRTQEGRSRRWSLACGAMGFVVVLFLVRGAGFVGSPTITFFGLPWSVPLGDMWTLLRILSFLWEVGAGQIAAPTLASYLAWVMFPFTLVGPLIRYSEFAPQYAEADPASRREPANSEVRWAEASIATMQIVAGSTLELATHSMLSMNDRWPKVLIAFGTGPWGFYFTTAGTFRLMECLATSWNVRLPPSFDRPFGQPNLAEFWARWNMTVTRVCRDYLFYNRWGLRRVNVFVNTVVLFLAVGLWHGVNLYWTTWGLLHGVGFCTYLALRRHRTRLAAAFERFPSRARRLGSAVVTYVFVCSCWHLANKISIALLRW